MPREGTSWPVLVENANHVPVDYSSEGTDSRDMAFPTMTIWVVSEWDEAVPRKEVLGKKLNSMSAIPAPLFSFLPANCNLSFATLTLLNGLAGGTSCKGLAGGTSNSIYVYI